MKVTIIYSIITLSVWVLGMILDVIGLYIGVKFASKGKVFPSKIGYLSMKIGEILEGITKEAMLFIPILFLVELLRIV